MAVTGYKTPGTCANVDRDAKSAWSDPDNAKTSNDAWASNDVLKTEYSDWLRVTNFGFTATDIPAGSTIDGFDVRVERKAFYADNICDSALYLRKTASQQGDNKASAAKWGTSEASPVYNWTSGQFGALVYSDIVANAGFGADFSVLNDADAETYAYVDVISIRVYYTILSSPQTAYPGLGSTEDRDGKALWTNPTNIQVEASYAHSDIAASTYSDWLRASDFGFAIPSTAVIDGIKVEINRWASAASVLKDSSLRLVDASGTNVGDDKASGSYWPTDAVTATYGSDSDTWGASPTPAMVNDSDFGIRLSVANDAVAIRSAVVYWVKITVYYTEGGVTHYGAATLSGVGTLAAIGRGVFIGAAALAGTGTLAAIGSFLRYAKATLSGTGALSAAGSFLCYGKATLSGTGTLAAIGRGIFAGRVTLSGIGTLTASAVVGGIKYGVVALSGVGTLVSNGVIIAIGKASLTGIGSLSAIGRRIFTAKATLVGTGTLSAIGQVILSTIKYGKATLVGAGTLTANAVLTAIGKATLAGVGTLAVIGQIIKISRFGRPTPRSIPSFSRSNIQVAERHNIQEANRHNIQESKR